MNPAKIEHTSLSARLTRVNVAVTALFVGVAVLACMMPAQSDTWWLLRTGEEMWRSRQVALHDTFTHTVTGQYWPNHEWLSQVLFFAAYALGGLPLLTALCAAAVVAGWAVVYRLTPGATLDRVMLVGCGAAFSTAGWSLRPQVFTFALFGVVLSLLVRRRALWILPPLFLVWANVHGGVAAGGTLIAAALIASAGVERRVDRSLLVIAVLCLTATAMTPLGPSLWLEVPKSLQRLKTYEVLEWRAPSLLNPSDFPFWFALSGAAVLAMMRRDALRRWDTALLAIASAFSALLALRSARNSGLFLLCAIPLAGRLLFASSSRPSTGREGREQAGLPSPSAEPRRAARWAMAALIGAAAIFVAYAWSRPLERLQWQPVGEQMRSAIDACPGPLYNRYDEGGYLVWFVRSHKVFIDSRQDPFPESLVLAQLQVEKTGDYRETFERYGIACALTVDGSVLANRLHAAGWHPQNAGQGWTVYARPGSGP